MSDILTSFKNYGLDYSSINSAEGLAALDCAFVNYIAAQHPELRLPLASLRAADISKAEHSQLALNLAPALDDFMLRLFAVQDDNAKLVAALQQDACIFEFKDQVVLRLARKRLRHAEDLRDYNVLNDELKRLFASDTEDYEYAIAQLYATAKAEAQQSSIDLIVDWTASVLLSDTAPAKAWPSFKLAERMDFNSLLKTETVSNQPLQITAQHELIEPRVGFDLTDQGCSRREAVGEMHYCILCQQRDNDTCSKGFPLKKQQYNDGFKSNALGVELTGCPLEQKISEMHELKRAGYSLAALATAMIDNPLIPLTGHRICNDCMLACIYQKQTPVDIPEAESRILQDVLNLPYGVEIYSLLLRWNPLRRGSPGMPADNGYKIAVMGLGPAGIAMTQQMLQAGYTVAAFDGLKLEPPTFDPLQPVKSFDDFCSPLSQRQVTGFGGVAEYGITVRWNKNYLNLVLLCLLRYKNFQAIGSVRFGGSLTVESTRRYGFDHLCLAVGAGLPQAINVDNSLAPGMRMASEFLMTLHLQAPQRLENIAALQIDLPLVVVGGGLTAIDTATEAQAYYLEMIVKVYMQFNSLSDNNKQKLEQSLSPNDWQRIMRYCQHAKLWQEEMQLAASQERSPDATGFIKRWGGVTIIYRRRIQDSPAYRDFTSEIQEALNQGVSYMENLQPVRAILDNSGQVKALDCLQAEYNPDWQLTDQEYQIPARCILLATGSKPNIAYEYEHRGTFQRAGDFYKAYKDAALKDDCADDLDLQAQPGALSSQVCAGMHVSFIGDMHPKYAGSVVRALASAKDQFPALDALIYEQAAFTKQPAHKFLQTLVADFTSTITLSEKLTDNWHKLVVTNKSLATAHQSGQFYRLQTFNATAPAIEPLAADALVDVTNGTLTFVLDARLPAVKVLASLDCNTPLAVLGPTGARDVIAAQNILVLGTDKAQTALLARRQELSGKHVSFISLAEDSSLINQLQDFIDNVVEIKLEDFLRSAEDFIKQNCDPTKIEAVYIWGPAKLACKLKTLTHLFNDTVQFKAYVAAQMQCMLKGVCADCLQWQIDPKTGKRTKAVYSCSWQMQPLHIVDWEHAATRGVQNKALQQLAEFTRI